MIARFKRWWAARRARKLDRLYKEMYARVQEDVEYLEELRKTAHEAWLMLQRSKF